MSDASQREWCFYLDDMIKFKFLRVDARPPKRPREGDRKRST